jgi:hypothetical protein
MDAWNVCMYLCIASLCLHREGPRCTVHFLVYLNLYYLTAKAENSVTAPTCNAVINNGPFGPLEQRSH